MDRIRKTLILGLTLPLIGAIALGCNTGTEEPDAPQAETSAGTATGAANDAASAAGDSAREPDDIDPARFPELPAGASAAMPDNFPSDLPVYPGAVPAQGRGASSDTGEIAGVQLLTNDSPDQAFGYYRDELESKGWGVENASEEDDKKSITVSKDGCKAIFMFVPSDSGAGTDIFTISSCEGA